MHGLSPGGEVSQEGTRAVTGVAEGAVRGHLDCAQGYQGSGVNAVGRSVGMTGRAARFNMGKPRQEEANCI